MKFKLVNRFDIKQPGMWCSRCAGTGRIPTDFIGTYPCPDCSGTGIRQ